MVVFSLAIVAVLAIVLSVTLTADRNRNNDNEEGKPFVADGDPITFEEFITSKFSPSYFNGSWWSSRELQWRDEANNLVVWNVETEETSLLVSSDTVGLVSSSATFIAFGGQTKSLLLFKDQVESVWRHSFLAQYFVLDVTKNETLALTPNNHPDGTKLQYAQWVPQTDKVVYVFDNNIYIRDILKGNGEDEQITSDGVIDTVYNGIPDWVYEEEILSTNKAMYFTDSGSKLAYAKFNDEDVQEFYYTKYGSPEDPYKVQVRHAAQITFLFFKIGFLPLQYPQEIMLKYPKVGTANPTVSLWVSDLKAPNQVVPVTPPRDVAEGHLYTAAKWVSEDVLSIIWTNRVQNESRQVQTFDMDGQLFYVHIISSSTAFPSAKKVQRNGYAKLSLLLFSTTVGWMFFSLPSTSPTENHFCKFYPRNCRAKNSIIIILSYTIPRPRRITLSLMANSWSFLFCTGMRKTPKSILWEQVKERRERGNYIGPKPMVKF